MEFETRSTDTAEKAFEALTFLREASKQNKLSEIKNMQYVLDCLDISEQLGYAINRLKQFHIDE